MIKRFRECLDEYLLATACIEIFYLYIEMIQWWEDLKSLLHTCIRKEGECPTPLWYCVTTLYWGRDTLDSTIIRRWLCLYSFVCPTITSSTKFATYPTTVTSLLNLTTHACLTNWVVYFQLPGTAFIVTADKIMWRSLKDLPNAHFLWQILEIASPHPHSTTNRCSMQSIKKSTFI